MTRALFIALCLFVCSCASRTEQKSALSTIQLIDRNGFSETISMPERLSTHRKTNFIEPQPYAKVVRHYGRTSVITTYHDNGQIAEYLEVFGGRASGRYCEWYPSGAVKLTATLIEGVGELDEASKESWVFDGLSQVWSEQGDLTAEISYSKGRLEGESRYYRTDGSLLRTVPYIRGEIDGEVCRYSFDNTSVGVEQYRGGVREGVSKHRGDANVPRFEEEYAEGKLLHGYYYDFDDALIAYVDEGNGEQALFEKGHLTTIRNIRGGIPEGKVQEFAPDGSLQGTHSIKNGLKHGTEVVYYAGTEAPRLSLEWRNGLLHGLAKTWYENGNRESEREMYKNAKHGLSLAWYVDGSVMHVEEYENDLLIKGSYMKKGEQDPISSVEKGSGIATLFDSEGYLLERVSYEKGQPAIQ